ncbi:hypothetical protein HN51_041570 [Arachis hypogaea]
MLTPSSMSGTCKASYGSLGLASDNALGVVLISQAKAFSQICASNLLYSIKIRLRKTWCGRVNGPILYLGLPTETSPTICTRLGLSILSNLVLACINYLQFVTKDNSGSASQHNGRFKGIREEGGCKSPHCSRLLRRRYRHLMENVSTTQALQASQARTLKTLSDCITSHGKILEILWEEYADRRRKQYPQAGIEPCKADWPGKKEAVIANKDFDSSDDEHGREVLGENLGDVTPLLFEIKKDGLLSSEDMPKFLDVDFRPPKGIKFIATELAVAAYIFARDLEQGEILYSGEHCHGARHAFWSLRPRQEVVDDVINLVATILNDERHDSVWWLPTTFDQIALNPSTYCKETLAFIRHKYMKYVDDTPKVKHLT